jgi:hypothetical protein
MSDRAAVLRHILRTDLTAFHQLAFSRLEPGKAFSPNWHFEHIAWKLEQVMRGEVRRLIINVPPRSGKSLLASVAWPMFVLGRDPTKRFMCVSHTEDLARTFALSRLAIAQSPWYRELFPQTVLSAARPRPVNFATTRRGGCSAAGVGGAVLGRGADIILADDPAKGEGLSDLSRRRVAEFFDNTLITRLDERQRGAIVIIMQRLHEHDLVGHVLERGEWEVVALPAIAPEEAVFQLSENPADVYRRSAWTFAETLGRSWRRSGAHRAASPSRPNSSSNRSRRAGISSGESGCATTTPLRNGSTG